MADEVFESGLPRKHNMSYRNTNLIKQILKATETLFAEKGFSRIPIREIIAIDISSNILEGE